MGRLRTIGPRVATLKPRLAVTAAAATSWRTGKTTNQRGYNYRWQQMRKSFLRLHPLCQCPNCDEGRKRVTPAEVVDHRNPHEGPNDPRFWDVSNWQALSKHCHDSWKQRQDRARR